MRKKYIKPEMKVYEIGTSQLLAASGAGAPEVDFYPDEGHSVLFDYYFLSIIDIESLFKFAHLAPLQVEDALNAVAMSAFIRDSDALYACDFTIIASEGKAAGELGSRCFCGGSSYLR